MHQSKTGADSLKHRLQSLFAFWLSVYRRPVAIHITAQQRRTTADMAFCSLFLAFLSNWGGQLVLLGLSLSEI